MTGRRSFLCPRPTGRMKTLQTRRFSLCGHVLPPPTSPNPQAFSLLDLDCWLPGAPLAARAPESRLLGESWAAIYGRFDDFPQSLISLPFAAELSPEIVAHGTLGRQ